MEYESEIKRLEDFVERLLAGYTELKAEIKKQAQELQAQQHKNDQLQQQIESMELERGDLGGRVSTLIERIEAWESELEVTEIAGDPSDDPADDLESETEDSDQEQAELDGDESSGGVQGNLFTAKSASR